jgi:hypothetical protein
MSKIFWTRFIKNFWTRGVKIFGYVSLRECPCQRPYQRPYQHVGRVVGGGGVKNPKPELEG